MSSTSAGTTLVGAAIPIGAGLGGTLAVLLGKDLVVGASVGIAGGIVTTALIVQLLARVGPRHRRERWRLAIGAGAGGVVAGVLAASVAWGASDTILTTLVSLTAGMGFGGFLGWLHPANGVDGDTTGDRLEG